MTDGKTYNPTENEEYMNPNQLHYFELKLLERRKELLSFSQESKNELKDKPGNAPDPFDVATRNTEFAMGVEDMERNRKSLITIDKALARINSGEYGYCDLSGEEIGIRRLQAQPTATLCVEVQEMLEKNSQMTTHVRPEECFFL